MLTLNDIMTTDLVTVSPDMNLHELAEVFASKRISGAPVVAGVDLVGVISSSDLLEFESTSPGSPRHRADQTDWGEVEDSREWEAETPARVLLHRLLARCRGRCAGANRDLGGAGMEPPRRANRR